MKIYYFYGKISTSEKEKVVIDFKSDLTIVKSGFRIIYSIPFIGSFILLMQKAWLGGFCCLFGSYLFFKIFSELNLDITSNSAGFSFFINWTFFILSIFFTACIGLLGNLFYIKNLKNRGFSLLCEVSAKNKTEAIKLCFDLIKNNNKVIFKI